MFFSMAAFAQAPKSGKVKLDVSPKEAYIFVDGEAKGPGNRSIEVTPGMHTILVANYGHKFHQEEVSVEPDSTVSLNIKLEPFGGTVFGPRGRIQIESGSLPADKSAVLLNGKTPDYFVGHVDEFNNDTIWHQELIVPPGPHQVTVTRNGKEVWSGEITVAENQRVIINMANGEIHVKNWERGMDLGELDRFNAGTASATVAVAPVTGKISANAPTINCGQESQLTWHSADAVDAHINGMGTVPLNGNQTVSPRQTTTYNFVANGPGGVLNSNATVVVNPTVISSLSASPVEVRYRRIGDKVIEQGSTMLNWSTSNAGDISLSPYGEVANFGSKTLVLTPKRTTDGAVDETMNITLHASNVCGGSEVKTVAVHLTGSIEPIPDVSTRSIFFPTDYPTKTDPSLGLARSEQQVLTDLARSFTKYLEYDPDAKLTLAAFADTRETKDYNQALSERRAELVKGFLVTQGIAEDKITFSAYGKEKQLDGTTILDLQNQNPNPPAMRHENEVRALKLAYNRRVDIVFLPANRESVRLYPHEASASDLLWQIAKPDRKVVQDLNQSGN